MLALIVAGADRLVKKFIGYNPEYAADIVELLPMGDKIVSQRGLTGWEMVGTNAVEFNGGTSANVVEGFRSLSLERRPVRSIASIYENPAAWATAGGDFPASTLLAATDYQIDYNQLLNGTPCGWSGQVLRRAGSWYREPRTIKVTYTAGLTANELSNDYPELKLAAYDTIIKQFNEYSAQQGAAAGGAAGSVVAERLADYSVQFDATSAAYLTGFMIDLPQSAKQILWDFVSMRKFLQ